MNEGGNETDASFTHFHVARHSGTASDLGTQFSSSLIVDGESTSPLRVDDVIVFVALESLGTLAITGNLCLIIVLLRNRYLHRASFILMLSLAIADVLHGIVTTSFFYPPIVLKSIPIPDLAIRAFNIVDWTAWSITLTHMSAICLDRLIAIMLYGRYNMIVTVQRIRTFTITCWTIFALLNTAYILLEFCCLITPLKSNQFYTFGYGEFESDYQDRAKLNAFTFTYTPIELATIAILSISNPITLVQLYRRHKRKLALRHQNVPPIEDYKSGSALGARSQWQRASTMLLEMSMRMGSKALTSDVRELATRRSNRQQQRILLQISVVAVIFYLYMTTYYLLYHVFLIENKWVVLFNSFFYSTTHMINPVIYFSLNKEMRLQLIAALNVFLNFICCIGSKPEYGSIRKPSGEQKSYSRTSNKFENSFTATESSPLMPFRVNSSSNNNLKCNNYHTTSNNNFHYITRNPSKARFPQSNELLSSLNEVLREDTGTSTFLPATTVLSEEVTKTMIPNGKTTSYSMIVDMELPVETLELDLVSSSSVDREMSGLSSSQLKLDRTTSCGLAKKLEEYARTFIEAQDIAMNKACEQRTNLLDALIRALSQNAPDEEGGFTGGPADNIPLITEDPAPEDLAHLCHFESSSSLVRINETSLKPHLRKQSRSLEINGRIPNSISACLPSPIIGSTIRRASLLSNATCSGRIAERSRMNKRTSIPDAQLASVNKFLAQYHRRYSSASERFANLEQSTSFQQWRDLKSSATSSYAKITQAREMLRESLRVLLDESSSSFLPEVEQETLEGYNGKNESESDEEEEVVFL